MMRTRDTLGLDNDLDPNELQDALETSFGIRFSIEEATACKTVGDVFQVICNQLSVSRQGAEGCATAMAFYRLRRALSDLSEGTRSSLTSKTSLENFSGLSARSLLAKLSQHSGLRLPKGKAALPRQVGAWMMLAGLVWLLLTAVVAPSLWFTGIAVGVLGLTMIRIDPGRLPDDCRTLGELALRVAGLNFGNLHAKGAKARDLDVWNAMLEVLSEYTLMPKTEIHPETLISQKQPQSV